MVSIMGLAVFAVLTMIISEAQCQLPAPDKSTLFAKQYSTITIQCPLQRANQTMRYGWSLPKGSTARKEHRVKFGENGRTIYVRKANIKTDTGIYTCVLNTSNSNVIARNLIFVQVYAKGQCPMTNTGIVDNIKSTLKYFTSPDGNRLNVQFPFYGNPGDLLVVEWFDAKNWSISKNPRYKTSFTIDHQLWKVTVKFSNSTPNIGSFLLRMTLYDPACRFMATVQPTEQKLLRVAMAHAQIGFVNGSTEVACSVGTHAAPNTTVEWQWRVCPPSRRGETWPIVERCVQTPKPYAIRKTERIGSTMLFSTFQFRTPLPGIAMCIATDNLGSSADNFTIIYLANNGTASQVVLDTN